MMRTPEIWLLRVPLLLPSHLVTLMPSSEMWFSLRAAVNSSREREPLPSLSTCNICHVCNVRIVNSSRERNGRAGIM